jgi:hypothetical protein
VTGVQTCALPIWLVKGVRTYVFEVQSQMLSSDVVLFYLLRRTVMYPSIIMLKAKVIRSLTNLDMTLSHWGSSQVRAGKLP